MLTKIIHIFALILLVISAVFLLLMMSLTAVDVVLRKIYGLPISGADELTQYMMAFIVPFGIAYCAQQKGHVSVEILFKKLPKIFQSIIGIIVPVSTLLFTAAIAWQNILYIFMEFGQKAIVTSAVLKITTYPFYAPVALGIGTYTIVITFQLVKSLGKVRAK